MAKLAQDEKFLQICSATIGEIQKHQGLISQQEASDREIEVAAAKDAKEKFLSADALQYYLSLK